MNTPTNCKPEGEGQERKPSIDDLLAKLSESGDQWIQELIDSVGIENVRAKTRFPAGWVPYELDAKVWGVPVG